jgi:hypothetical protein
VMSAVCHFHNGITDKEENSNELKLV